MQANKTKKPKKVYNHEGVRVKSLSPEQELERSIMAAMLWEGSFYENGEDHAARVSDIMRKVKPERVREMAIKARTEQNLRHMPLFLAREMCRHFKGRVVGDTIKEVIQRPDEINELVAMYWNHGKKPLPAQMKKGLARAFRKFSRFQLSKWNKKKTVTLRDVMRMVHPTPLDKKQEKLWEDLINERLRMPDSWETELSKGDVPQRVAWTRLLEENKVGGMALLRNLRNMQQAGVDRGLIRSSLKRMKTDRILPFRFIAAANHAPELMHLIEEKMFESLKNVPKLEGLTALVIDTSPSMWMDKVSQRSELSRFDAAAALAILAREICEDVNIYTFNRKAYKVPPLRGFPLKNAMAKTQDSYSRGGLGVHAANQDGYDRIIVLTDGQWHQSQLPNERTIGRNSWYMEYNAEIVSPDPLTDKAYLLNVHNYRNGVGYGKWNVINGFSEACLTYIHEYEQWDDRR